MRGNTDDGRDSLRYPKGGRESSYAYEEGESPRGRPGINPGAGQNAGEFFLPDDSIMDSSKAGGDS